MRRQRSTVGKSTPLPGGDWLAGAIIGALIMTMATQAVVVGAGAAIKNATLKND